MKKSILSFLLIACSLACTAQTNSDKSIEINKLNLSWHFDQDRIFFEMSAPTDGWLTIGFNTHTGMQGAYLLMGHIVNGEAIN